MNWKKLDFPDVGISKSDLIFGKYCSLHVISTIRYWFLKIICTYFGFELSMGVGKCSCNHCIDLYL